MKHVAVGQNAEMAATCETVTLRDLRALLICESQPEIAVSGTARLIVCQMTYSSPDQGLLHATDMNCPKLQASFYFSSHS